MTDIDQTNIYSYKGPDYCKALKDYLTTNGLDVDGIEVESGYISIRTKGVSKYTCPQFTQWKWIEVRLRQWMS